MASTPAGDQTDACTIRAFSSVSYSTWPSEGSLVPARSIQRETPPAVGVIQIGRLADQFDAALVDLERLVGDAELAPGSRTRAEGIGLRQIGAGGEITGMNLAHQIGRA